MKRLIINADDLGFSAAVNRGILLAHREGLVTAATCLVTHPGFADALGVVEAAPALDVGLHLDLTGGQPVCDESLGGLARGGRFRGPRGLLGAILSRSVREDQILKEASAQVRRFRDRFGSISHLDVHQHAHVLGPVWRAVCRLVEHEGIPFVRLPADPNGQGLGHRWIGRVFQKRRQAGPPAQTPDHFCGLALTGRLNSDRIVQTFRDLKPGLTELMVHPGDAADAADTTDRLSDRRAQERDALCSDAARQALETEGIILTTFRASNE